MTLARALGSVAKLVVVLFVYAVVSDVRTWRKQRCQRRAMGRDL